MIGWNGTLDTVSTFVTTKGTRFRWIQLLPCMLWPVYSFPRVWICYLWFWCRSV